MISVFSRRFFHTSRAHLTTARSSALGKLRKSTGYSVSNCKKAVELFPEDIAKAEEWLHAEAKQKGWAKWAKIQTRSATQGLIGVFSKDKVGVMVEVNCETDFVAKNAEFHQLVENVLAGCINHMDAHPIAEDCTKTVLDETQLNGIQYNSTTLGELVNFAVSKFSEKTVAKRALCFKVKDNIDLCSLSHPSINCPNLHGATLGKYGTLLAFKNNNSESILDKDLVPNICQHIIGMNPLSVGQLSEQDILSFTSKSSSDEAMTAAEPEIIQDIKVEDIPEKAEDHGENEVEDQDTLNDNLKDTDETRLLFQPFLLDSNVCVGETLHKSGIEIVHFERLECGETQSENLEDKQSAAISN